MEEEKMTTVPADGEAMPAVDNDEDIDAYIRELTGKEPKKEEKKEPEIEHFRVTSQIGEDDHKAFIYYSTLLRYKWVVPVFAIVPLVFSLFFSFSEGKFYSGNFVLALVVLYVAITLIVVIRCQRWLSRIRKNNPKTLYLTDTTLAFLTYHVVNMKNGNHIKVSYDHLIDVCESRKRFILYFDNGKSMVFRKEDMPVDVQEKFRPFIQSKVHKPKMFKK